MSRAKIFILEDDNRRMLYIRGRFFDHDITHITSCEDVSKFKPPYDAIFLDHDLGKMGDSPGDNGTIFIELVKDILDFRSSPIVVIHSYNGGAAARMVDRLSRLGAQVTYAPFRGMAWEAIVDRLLASWSKE